MKGIGVDLICMKRIEEMITSDNQNFFVFFTDDEHNLGETYRDKALFYAERFAAKEAVFKCFNIEMDIDYLKEIETLNGTTGKPYVNLYGKIKSIAAERKFDHIDISISHDNQMVIAFAAVD